MAAEDANLRNWRFGTLGDLAARVRNYASRGRESANYGGAILLGLTALEWEEGSQHTTLTLVWCSLDREMYVQFCGHGVLQSHTF